jgi:multiple sugar transport system ATP-binding protein
MVEFGGFRIPLAAPYDGKPSRVIVGVRPEAFEDASLGDSSLPQIEVRVDVIEDLGPDTHVIFQVDSPPIDVTEVREAAGDEDAVLLQVDKAVFTARVDPRTAARPGRQITLSVDPARFHFFDLESGLRIEHAATPALASA